MYSNCQVAGIVLETMAASGNRRTDLVPWADGRCKFINWFRQGRRNYVPMHSQRLRRRPEHNNEVAATGSCLIADYRAIIRRACRR